MPRGAGYCVVCLDSDTLETKAKAFAGSKSVWTQGDELLEKLAESLS